MDFDKYIRLKRQVYARLVPLWFLSRGHTRWLNFVSKALDIRLYGFFTQELLGQYWLRLDPGDANDRLFYFNMFGLGYTHILSRLLKTEDCVIDVGTNVAHFSAVASQHVGCGGL
jgi:hypothetical protein